MTELEGMLDRMSRTKYIASDGQQAVRFNNGPLMLDTPEGQALGELIDAAIEKADLDRADGWDQSDDALMSGEIERTDARFYAAVDRLREHLEGEHHD